MLNPTGNKTEEPGRAPAAGGGTDAGGDIFDAVTSIDLPENVEADFAPLPEPAGQTETPPDPFQRDSMRAQEAFDAAVASAAAGDEESAVQEYLRAAKIAESAREWYLAAVACQRVADFLIMPRPPCDVERALRMYRRAVAAYEQSGLFAEARELAYRVMYVRMRRARELKMPWHHALELRLHWLIAGFGFRPLRVVLTALMVTLVYGFAYWLMGGIYRPNASGPIDLWHAIYFSGVTFATIGYGDFVPTAPARLLALTEGFIGAFTIGLFVAVLANRLNRT